MDKSDATRIFGFAIEFAACGRYKIRDPQSIAMTIFKNGKEISSLVLRNSSQVYLDLARERALEESTRCGNTRNFVLEIIIKKETSKEIHIANLAMDRAREKGIIE